MDLRCHSKILHGVVVGDVLEVTCQSRWCGKRKGVTVLHKFNTTTGQLLSTSRYQEPKKEVNSNDNGHESSSVRIA